MDSIWPAAAENPDCAYTASKRLNHLSLELYASRSRLKELECKVDRLSAGLIDTCHVLESFAQACFDDCRQIANSSLERADLPLVGIFCKHLEKIQKCLYGAVDDAAAKTLPSAFTAPAPSITVSPGSSRGKKCRDALAPIVTPPPRAFAPPGSQYKRSSEEWAGNHVSSPMCDRDWHMQRASEQSSANHVSSLVCDHDWHMLHLMFYRWRADAACEREKKLKQHSAYILGSVETILKSQNGRMTEVMFYLWRADAACEREKKLKQRSACILESFEALVEASQDGHVVEVIFYLWKADAICRSQTVGDILKWTENDKDWSYREMGSTRGAISESAIPSTLQFRSGAPVSARKFDVEQRFVLFHPQNVTLHK